MEPTTRNFKLIGGALCLDFTNTVGWRGRTTQEELLNNYEDLLLWAKYVNILNEREYDTLLQIASKSPVQKEDVYRRAITLRESIYLIFSTTSQKKVPRINDIDVLNKELSIAHNHLILSYTEQGYLLELQSDEMELDQMLWFVAKSASELLVSDNLNRVRKCKSEECGWLFLDLSRNRSRRWCDMKDCGNRMKARRFYERTQTQQMKL